MLPSNVSVSPCFAYPRRIIRNTNTKLHAMWVAYYTTVAQYDSNHKKEKERGRVFIQRSVSKRSDMDHTVLPAIYTFLS